MAAKPHRLPAAQAEHAPLGQALREEADGPVLQGSVEVDQHVAAHDEVHLPQGAIGGQVVLSEHHVAGQRRVHDGRLVAGRVVVRKACLAPRLLVVEGVLAHLLQGEDPFPRSVDDHLIEVGGVLMASERSLFKMSERNCRAQRKEGVQGRGSWEGRGLLEDPPDGCFDRPGPGLGKLLGLEV